MTRDEEDDFDEDGSWLDWFWDFGITPVLSIMSFCAALAASAVCLLILTWCLGQVADIIMRHSV